MNTNELFWATGIDNTTLRANQQEAIQIFTTLANRVVASLDEITQKYGKVIAATKVKFDNPVDPAMISSIKAQIESLGKTIDLEITKLGNFTAKYDQSMTRISKSASKLQVGNNSPLAPMVAGIQKDVSKASENISFLENRFKYMAGSMLAYGSVSIFKNLASEIIEVKTQFEFLQTAINSFAGSSEKGAKIMHELTQFAVNSPLQVNDITEAAKQLMAFGVGADNVVGQIKMLSDVAAGAGKPIKEIAYIYGKSLTEGKVYTRTLMQFGNLGIPIYEALAKVMDTTPAKIKKMTQMGAVGFEDVKRAIESLTSAGGQYYGFSDKMMSTTAGLLSNVKDKWILAMKDMGESSDGFINGSVQLVDSAIANWKALGDAILVAATAVGTYQVAKMVSSLRADLSVAGANIAEANSLATLISAETAEGIAKKGLVVGSLEYQAAIRAEIALMVQSAETAVVAAEAEVTAAEEAVAIKATKLRVGKLQLAQGELFVASETQQALTTNVATAANVGAVAGTNLLAAATARLGVMFRNLTATMEANPYVFATTAIATLVAVMWSLHDSTTAAEKAQKNLGLAMDAIDKRAELKSKMFSDNLDKVKNKTLKDTAEQQAAYEVLHNIFGAIIGDKTTIADLQKLDSSTLQNKEIQAGEYKKLGEKYTALKKLEADITTKKADYNAPQAASMYGDTTNSARTSLGEQINVLQKQYKLQLKDYNDFAANYKAAKNAKTIDDTVEDKTYWTEQRKKAVENLDGIVSDEKAILNKVKPTKVVQISGVSDMSVKAYVENNAIIKAADEALKAYEETKQAKAVISAQSQRSKEAAEAAKRLEQIRANNAELVNLKSKAETDATQAAIDAMDAGYAKEKAQQENNFEKKLTSLASEKAKMLKMEQENVRNIFLNMNPKGGQSPEVSSVGTAKGGTTAAYTSLLSQATAGGMTKTVALINESLATANGALATYNSEVDSAQKDNDAKLGVLLEKQLLEYGDYTAKKTKIEKDYDLTLSALEKDRADAVAKGDTGLVGRIDSASIQANVNKSKEQISLAFDQLKSTPEYSLAFEDAASISTETLHKLMGEFDKFKNTAAGAISLKDFKFYAMDMMKITDEFIKRNPFMALKMSADDLLASQKELENVKLSQNLAQSGLKVGNDGMLAPISGVEQTNALAIADNKVAMAENNVRMAHSNSAKAVKTITDAYGELSKQMSSLGGVIGGTAGEIISSIGDIGSFVSTSIAAWETASNMAAGVIKTVEQASVILAVISAVITVATKIAAIFTNASKKRQEEAQKELDSIAAVKKAYLEAYAAMTDKKFSNIFGDDVFGKATAQAGLMKIAADNFKSSFDEMVKANHTTATGLLTIPFFAKFFGNNLKTDIASLLGSFDEVAAKAQLAGDKLNTSDRTNLQSLVDQYDAYVSYLDGVNSYLSGVFGQLGSEMMDALSTDAGNMTQWADDVTGYISDSFLKMAKDLVYSMDLAPNLLKEQAAIQAIMTDSNLNDIQKQEAILNSLAAYKKQAIVDGAQANADLNTITAGMTSAGFDPKTATTNKNSTQSAIKSMDQPTADILTAQFSAMRIHTSNMDTNIAKYFPELLLSLQGQAGILQLAFADVSQIRQNTMRIPEMVDILKDIKTYGIKVL